MRRVHLDSIPIRLFAELHRPFRRAGSERCRCGALRGRQRMLYDHILLSLHARLLAARTFLTVDQQPQPPGAEREPGVWVLPTRSRKVCCNHLIDITYFKLRRGFVFWPLDCSGNCSVYAIIAQCKTGSDSDASFPGSTIPTNGLRARALAVCKDASRREGPRNEHGCSQ